MGNTLEKVLKNVNARDKNQSQINFLQDIHVTSIEAREGARDDMILTNRMSRLTNFIATAKRLRAKRPISNIDSSWNERLKLTHKL